MAKILDLNALDQPVLDVRLRDDKRTVFHLTAPSVKLYEKFIAAKAEVGEIAKTRNEEKIRKLFELTAEIVSCNTDYITVTAEELRDIYRLKFGDVVIIFAAYLDFLKEINNAKN